MARIRSVHPGLFTDEAFVGLSESAQIFLIGLWTECDDQGAFEWKPVTLRMRLRPGKDGSVDPILAELADANTIKMYEHQGRKYGLVRNFKRFQNPRKPNQVYFIPPELRSYLGSRGASTDLEDVEEPPIPQKSETPLLMEGSRRGGEKEREKERQAAEPVAARDAAPGLLDENSLEGRLRKAADWWHKAPKLSQIGNIQALIAAGADLERDVLPTIKARAPEVSSKTSWKYFEGPILDAKAERLRLGTAINDAAKPVPPMKFVKRGTPDWDSCLAAGHKDSLKTERRMEDGTIADGWYFPSEFPPATAPAGVA